MTRETSVSVAILDHIVDNPKEKIDQCEVLPLGLNDHYVTL